MCSIATSRSAGDLFRRDYNSFNFIGNERTTTYQQVSTGGQIRAGVPLTENLNLALRYGLVYDEVTLDENLFFTDPGRQRSTSCPVRSAEGRPLSLRRPRQPPDLERRLFPALQHAQQFGPADQRPARLAPAGLCRTWRRHALSADAGQRDQVLERLQQLHLLAVGRGRLYPQLRGRRPGRRSGPPDRPLLPRQPADPRLRHSRRRPAHPAPFPISPSDRRARPR